MSVFPSNTQPPWDVGSSASPLISRLETQVSSRSFALTCEHIMYTKTQLKVRELQETLAATVTAAQTVLNAERLCSSTALEEAETKTRIANERAKTAEDSAQAAAIMITDLTNQLRESQPSISETPIHDHVQGPSAGKTFTIGRNVALSGNAALMSIFLPQCTIL